MNNSEWLFDEPRNLAVITTQDIIKNRESILYVSHDAEDGGWQFLAGSNVSMSSAMVVALHRVLALDKSLMSLADLPLGWIAKRESINKPWVRFERIE